MIRTASLILLVAIAASSAVAATAAPPRQPTGSWVVNFDAAQCVASRNYGTEEEPLHLVLKAPPIGHLMQVVVVRPGGGGKYARHLKATIEMERGEKIDTSLLAFRASETNQRLFRINVPRKQFDAVSKAKTIRIRAREELDESFELTQMASLLHIMAECADDLRRVWNVNMTEVGDGTVIVDLNPNLREAARGDLQGLFRASDYPDVAVRERQVGTAMLALLVDETGRIADCTVIATSDFAALDAQSCAMVQERARFKPAVGLDGKPAKDAVVQRITWQLK